jgi:hypothetical protein
MKLSCQWFYGYLLWQSWGSCLLHLQKWLPMASLKGVPSNDTQTRRVISMRAMQLAGESFVRGCCQIHEAWREIPIGFQVGLSSGDAAVEICQVDSNLNWLWFQYSHNPHDGCGLLEFVSTRQLLLSERDPCCVLICSMWFYTSLYLNTVLIHLYTNPNQLPPQNYGAWWG